MSPPRGPIYRPQGQLDELQWRREGIKAYRIMWLQAVIKGTRRARSQGIGGSWLPAVLFATLFAWGCNQDAPPLLKVTTTGTSTEVDLANERPDESLRQLAHAGIDAAAELAPALARFADLASGLQIARSRHDAAPYRVQAVAGWPFQIGWYRHPENGPDVHLRARLEDETGKPAAWDVGLEENYAPDLHDKFPAELVRYRFELDRALPATGRLNAVFLAPIPAPASGIIEAFGSGTMVLAPPLLSVDFEGLNAVIPVGGEVSEGVIVLKTLAGGTTLQFTGHYHRLGLLGKSTLLRNAKPVGEVDSVDGHWQIRNGAGVFPLNP